MAEPMTDDHLAKIEARANAAENGWSVVADTDDPYRYEIHGDGPTRVAVFGGDPDDSTASYPTEENARFAAHARSDVPELLAEVKRLAGELDEARAAACALTLAAHANGYDDSDVTQVLYAHSTHRFVGLPPWLACLPESPGDPGMDIELRAPKRNLAAEALNGFLGHYQGALDDVLVRRVFSAKGSFALTLGTLRRLRDRADAAEAELAKYVGWEPTVKEEYEHACAVAARAEAALGEYLVGSQEDVPGFIASLKIALEMN
jgi:hypothetical protein